MVDQLLAELDGATTDNDGLFVLAASNHPWDIDSALLRPGRFDRTVLVLPPDVAAREAILRFHLRGRPIGRLDLAKVAKPAAGLSGADLALVRAGHRVGDGRVAVRRAAGPDTTSWPRT